MSESPLLSVRDLRCHFRIDAGLVKAVDGVSFDIARGESLGIVGESGSGKSVTNMAMLRLVPEPPAVITGEALFGPERENLLKLDRDEIRRIRGRKISMIFQDPMTSLNPFLRIERQMTEGIQLHLGLDRDAARKRAIEWLERVGIPRPANRIFQYPHEFSGGMRQRVMIAMALSTEPQLLIADEPTTALDVTIQAQILDLIKELQRDLDTAVIMITHDLGVIAGMCERVVVMYAGRLVEKAPAAELFPRPAHPYTVGLLGSVPRLDQAQHTRLSPVEGQPPDLSNLPAGCSFRPRCPHAFEKCTQDPVLEPVPGADERDERLYACWLEGLAHQKAEPTGARAASARLGVASAADEAAAPAADEVELP